MNKYKGRRLSQPNIVNQVKTVEDPQNLPNNIIVTDVWVL